MESSAQYTDDVLSYFDGRPWELGLYEVLFERMDEAFPCASVKVQKSQISFYGRHLFAAVSLPVRRKRDWPKHCLLVTFGLGQRLDAPRIAVATEPYPRRWTHHVVLYDAAQIDSELLGWLTQAWTFSECK